MTSLERIERALAEVLRRFKLIGNLDWLLLLANLQQEHENVRIYFENEAVVRTQGLR